MFVLRIGEKYVARDIFDYTSQTVRLTEDKDGAHKFVSAINARRQADFLANIIKVLATVELE